MQQGRLMTMYRQSSKQASKQTQNPHSTCQIRSEPNRSNLINPPSPNHPWQTLPRSRAEGWQILKPSFHSGRRLPREQQRRVAGLPCFLACLVEGALCASSYLTSPYIPVGVVRRLHNAYGDVLIFPDLIPVLDLGCILILILIPPHIHLWSYQSLRRTPHPFTATREGLQALGRCTHTHTHTAFLTQADKKEKTKKKKKWNEMKRNEKPAA